VVAAFPL